MYQCWGQRNSGQDFLLKNQIWSPNQCYSNYTKHQEKSKCYLHCFLIMIANWVFCFSFLIQILKITLKLRVSFININQRWKPKTELSNHIVKSFSFKPQSDKTAFLFFKLKLYLSMFYVVAIPSAFLFYMFKSLWYCYFHTWFIICIYLYSVNKNDTKQIVYFFSSFITFDIIYIINFNKHVSLHNR